MHEKKYEFSYHVFDSIEQLPEEERTLLQQAREVTAHSYAPYSHFHVGAVALLANGKTVSGSNQENASFPVGLCAERVLLGAVSSLYPSVPIQKIAISYNGEGHANDRPISPCGICRQSLQEYESRTKSPIKIIMGGMKGPVFVLENSSLLLPLAFTSDELA